MFCVHLLSSALNSFLPRRATRFATRTETEAFLSTVRGLLLVRPITLEVHETGLALAQRYGLSTYDAMIAASALLADADVLWSEDMQHGQVLDGRLRIVNPFRAAG